MKGVVDHLMVAPILLPLVTAALMLLVEGRGHRLKGAINLVSTLLLVVICVLLLGQVEGGGTARTGVYLLGGWAAPLGIVLVVDLLSALMLLLGALMGLATLVYALARWHRAGVHFHPLFQLFLMGLNGAFLTGDLFNLFVFFEVMLAASYGLALHGLGVQRVKAGLHYLVINLAGSMVFLVGVAVIYGVTGTLNMADLAQRMAELESGQRALFHSGAAMLGMAFLLKAGLWPLNFWLPTTYMSASPPVAGLFSIMSKLGVYVVLRLWLLWFGPQSDLAGSTGALWLQYGGMVTILVGLAGVLSVQGTARMAGFSVLVSSGTLLTAIGFHQQGLTAAALFYLVSSTLAIGALFLLTELMERGRGMGADVLAVTQELFAETLEEGEGEEEEVGVPLPATMAILGLSFIGCASLLAGLPPLSGFVSKFALLMGLVDGGEGGVPPGHWLLAGLLVLSGLVTLMAMIRAGIRLFWPALEREVPRVRLCELGPVVSLLALCVGLTVAAGLVMDYMEATAAMLHDPGQYIRAVLGTEATAREAL